MKWCSVLVLGLSLGCGHPPDSRSSADAHAVEEGGHRAPSTEEEKRLLAAIESSAPGAEINVGSAQVTAQASYFAASGAQCRRVSIVGSSKYDGIHLACADEVGWFFVPDIEGSLVETRDLEGTP